MPLIDKVFLMILALSVLYSATLIALAWIKSRGDRRPGDEQPIECGPDD